MGKQAERLRKRKLARKRPAWAKWYSKPRWKALRAVILAQQPFCARCGVPSQIVDHKTPHRGDSAMFYNQENLVGMCKRCHDSKTARIDSRFANGGVDRMVGRCDPDGLPVDPDHPWNKG